MPERETTPPSLSELIERRLSRRDFLARSGAVAPVLALPGGLAGGPLGMPSRGAVPALTFESVPTSTADRVSVPPGYTVDVVLRWGDPIVEGEKEFSLDGQSAEQQARRFGFNCDFNAFFPLTPGNSNRGLIAVNHEYPRGIDMLRDYEFGEPTKEHVDIEIASVGMSVVEIERTRKGGWKPRLGSKYNRRITAQTWSRISGPAAGNELLQRKSGRPEERAGTGVRGMIGNCSGGKTPWGTVLTGEENIHYNFAYGAEDNEVHRAYTLCPGPSQHRWEKYYRRFDLREEPNEPNCFGWIVEIDPFRPDRPPVKRTALGRIRHEGAATGLADDGRVVLYTGDDQRQQFIYKFVSERPWNPTDPDTNRDLLDHGTLYVARLRDDGRGEWLPLVPRGKLEDWSQAKILVYTRIAAQILGATPMDRPEDVDINPMTRRVYAALTSDIYREKADGGANPRAPNLDGHIIEFTENGGDLAATEFTWSIFLLCGDPKQRANTFYAGADTKKVDPLSCPDNFAFDAAGNLWIATDGQQYSMKCNDSLYAVPTFGPDRGVTRRFLNGPVGGEICGPEFTPDGRTLFVNIQHPGQLGGLANPTSRWPDGDFPRPSLIAVRRSDGGPIGS